MDIGYVFEKSLNDIDKFIELVEKLSVWLIQWEIRQQAPQNHSSDNSVTKIQTNVSSLAYAFGHLNFSLIEHSLEGSRWWLIIENKINIPNVKKINDNFELTTQLQRAGHYTTNLYLLFQHENLQCEILKDLYKKWK